MSIERGLVQGLKELESFLTDEKSYEGRVVAVTWPDLDVKRIREGLGLSQSAFAEQFQLSLRSVQNWERGAREPEAPARMYLTVIKHNHEAVLEALASEKEEVRRTVHEPERQLVAAAV